MSGKIRAAWFSLLAASAALAVTMAGCSIGISPGAARTSSDSAQETSADSASSAAAGSDVSSAESSAPGTSSNSNAESASGVDSFRGDIGKTLNELKKEHPDLQYKSKDLADASAECMAAPGGDTTYYFYGTQYFSLDQMPDSYGDKLKCAGIYAAVGVLFPDAKDGMSVPDFFALIGVTEYEVLEDEIELGWVAFTYQGMSGYLYGTPPVKSIKRDMSVLLVMDETLDQANMALVDEVAQALNDAQDSSSNS